MPEKDAGYAPGIFLAVCCVQIAFELE